MPKKAQKKKTKARKEANYKVYYWIIGITLLALLIYSAFETCLFGLSVACEVEKTSIEGNLDTSYCFDNYEGSAVNTCLTQLAVQEQDPAFCYDSEKGIGDLELFIDCVKQTTSSQEEFDKAVLETQLDLSDEYRFETDRNSQGYHRRGFYSCYLGASYLLDITLDCLDRIDSRICEWADENPVCIYLEDELSEFSEYQIT